MVIQGEGFLKILLTLLFGVVQMCSNAQQERILYHQDLFSAFQFTIVDKMEKKFNISAGGSAYSGVKSIPFWTTYNVSLPYFQPNNPAAIAPHMSMNQWGVICVGEWKFEQRTGIPLRFRLGSLQYVDMLEGKTQGYDFRQR